MQENTTAPAGQAAIARASGVDRPGRAAARTASLLREGLRESEDMEEIGARMAGFLTAIIQPEQIFEVRALGVCTPSYRTPHAELGYFAYDSIHEAVEQALGISPQAEGVYFTPNPIQPALQARSYNRLRPARAGDSAGDKDVLHRHFMLIDYDPKRPAKISSTDEEVFAAKDVANEVRTYLRQRGWPDPIFSRSGNGWHHLYRVDLPTDDDDLVRRCLAALESKFANDTVGIDTAVYNPSRLVRLYGTLARKGDDTRERPHRRSKAITIPDPLEIVPEDLMRALAAEAPSPAPPPAARPARSASEDRRKPTSPATGTAPARATKYLDKLPDSVTGEHGHDALFRAACVLAIDFALPREDALPILSEWNGRKAHPPWDERDLARKLDQALKKRDEAAAADPARVGRLLRQERDANRDAVVAAADPFAGSVTDLPAPRKIRGDLLPVPPLDEKSIPSPFRGWLADIAARVGCPLEYVAVAAIIAVATIVGRMVAIRPKRHDDWTVVPNLWGGAVGRPGVLKTPALLEALRPLQRLVNEAEDRYQAELKAFEARSIKAKLDAEAARDRYKAAAKAGKPQEVLDELQAGLDVPQVEPPVRRRYKVNDSTVEKWIELLRENPRGLLLFRDELIGWLRTLDKPGHESDRAFFLEGWNGTGSFTSDRIGRGTVHAEGICISILGGIQPGPLASYLRAAGRGNGREDDGLVSRLQLLVYPDPSSVWENVDRYPDTAAKNRAFEIFRRLEALDPRAIGAEVDEHRDGPPFLRFTAEAQELFDEWRAELENEKLRSNEDSPLIESHLAKYRSLMPSLALLFHLVEVVDGRASGQVGRNSAIQAMEWCLFLEHHVRRIYHASFEGDLDPASRLAQRIRGGSLNNPFTPREVAQKGWMGLDTVEEVERAVAILERFDWVRCVEVRTGGRPSLKVFVNPRVAEGVSP